MLFWLEKYVKLDERYYNETTGRLENLGLKVEFVGSMISDLVKDGYVPMIW